MAYLSIMEANRHSRDTYKTDGKVSFMEQDLLDYSVDFKSSFKLEPSDQRYRQLRRDKKEKLHVGVIGAGFAGLRCAEILIEAGAQVTILEARDRIGGRVSGLQCKTRRIIDEIFRSIK